MTLSRRNALGAIGAGLPLAAAATRALAAPVVPPAPPPMPTGAAVHEPSAPPLPPEGAPPTFPSWEPTRAIDHILVSSGMRVENIWTLPHPVSDHLPIAARVRLPIAMNRAA